MPEWLLNLMPNVIVKWPDYLEAIRDTLLMEVWAGSICFVIGLFLGVVITVTKPGGILPNRVIYQILDKAVNLFRSIPFIILLTALMPLSRWIMGTAIYVRGVIVPLVFGSVPFFVRQVEAALAQTDDGLVEAALSMGSSPMEVIFRVYLRESLAPLVERCFDKPFEELLVATELGCLVSRKAYDCASNFWRRVEDAGFYREQVFHIIPSLYEHRKYAVGFAAGLCCYSLRYFFLNHACATRNQRLVVEHFEKDL